LEYSNYLGVKYVAIVGGKEKAANKVKLKDMTTGTEELLDVDAAIAAATEDPRFVPVAVNELEEIVVEVNVLSPPKLVEKSAPDDRKRAVRIGRDGLMIQYGFRSGLLLPEVAIEHKWNKDEFLDSICEKAGLPKGTWKRPEVNLYTFTSQIFKETYPEGQVKEVFLE
ncbi:MAG: TIGR00296 family protein, partial [Candidatus Micrarchaeota archaeon]|nr:TIGR00296 family protein [Candidatus Micrarchaeota archaeon]